MPRWFHFRRLINVVEEKETQRLDIDSLSRDEEVYHIIIRAR